MLTTSSCPHTNESSANCQCVTCWRRRVLDKEKQKTAKAYDETTLRSCHLLVNALTKD
jgi:hypothetical protein